MVAVYRAKTGKALGAKDRQLLPHRSVLVDQPSTDMPSTTVSIAPRWQKIDIGHNHLNDAKRPVVHCFGGGFHCALDCGGT